MLKTICKTLQVKQKSHFDNTGIECDVLTEFFRGKTPVHS